MTEMQQYTPVAVPARVGQATSVEQSRAGMEVVAAVQAAITFPRSIADAVAEMTYACQSPTLAAKAFYSFPRAGGRVTGPTVDLARMLARCWGNMDTGVVELDRNEADGYSEMKAYAWDLQRNSRASTTFRVLHRRDTKDGPKPLSDGRDVYEKNANEAARREREMIFRVVPEWFRDQAIELCQQTLNNKGASQPMRIEQQRVKAAEAYDRVGVSVPQLEERVGKRLDLWTSADLADLNVLFREIDTGQITVDDVFGKRLQDADVKSQPKTGAAWPVQPYQGAQGQPAPSESLPESVTWPVVRQAATGPYKPGIRREQAVDTIAPDDYDPAFLPEGE